MLVGSAAELDPERAFIIAELTGTCCETLQDYDDAARAIKRWFALMAEPGARHCPRQRPEITNAKRCPFSRYGTGSDTDR